MCRVELALGSRGQRKRPLCNRAVPGGIDRYHEVFKGSHLRLDGVRGARGPQTESADLPEPPYRRGVSQAEAWRGAVGRLQLHGRVSCKYYALWFL